MIFVFFLSFLAGLATKFTDNLVDEPFLFNEKIRYFGAIAYGLLGGYLISVSTEFATLFLAVVAAVFLTGKIDNFTHQLAILTVITVIAFFGSYLVILVYKSSFNYPNFFPEGVTFHFAAPMACLHFY